MEIIFLGTSAAVPTRKRNLPSIILLYNGEQILFDAGEDVQRRYEDAGLKFNVPLSIFISHMHGDHVIGLPGLLFHFTLISRNQDVKIWGPPGIFSYLYLHRISTGLRAPFLRDIYEIYSEENKLLHFDFQDRLDQKPEEIPFEENIIFETSNYMVKSMSMAHSVPTTGFRFQEKPRPGRFDPKLAKQFNIPQGSLWKRMQMGETIIYKEKTYNPEKLGIVSPKRPGLIISYSADTKMCDQLKLIAKNADFFICEATFGDELKELAEEKSHMTASQAAEIAKESDVKQLVLTHISSRYIEGDTLLAEARSIFPNTIVAHDLMRLTPLKD
jgi:ribonuclease Z